jgi:hypothetical protein
VTGDDDSDVITGEESQELQKVEEDFREGRTFEG